MSVFFSCTFFAWSTDICLISIITILHPCLILISVLQKARLSLHLIGFLVHIFSITTSQWSNMFCCDIWRLLPAVMCLWSHLSRKSPDVYTRQQVYMNIVGGTQKLPILHTVNLHGALDIWKWVTKFYLGWLWWNLNTLLWCLLYNSLLLFRARGARQWITCFFF